MWGAFGLLVFAGPGLSGYESSASGGGSALALSVGFLLGGGLAFLPRTHRTGGLPALVAILAGAVLIVVGWNLSLANGGPGVPLDADWWLHRVGGAALIALGGAAIGRLPSIEDRPSA